MCVSEIIGNVKIYVNVFGLVCEIYWKFVETNTIVKESELFLWDWNSDLRLCDILVFLVILI